MQKVLISIIFILGFSVNMFSQVRERATIELTPKIGYSNFKYSVSGYPSLALKSVNFGMTADYYLNEAWSIRTGILYQKMGGQTFSSRYELDYLNIPLNANWHFGSTRKWNLNFGLLTGFKISNADEQNIFGIKSKETQTAINGGIGYKIEINNQIGILLDYQFLVGLTNIDQDQIYSVRNKGGNINVGLVIKL
ncbi:MAG: outer membrane beta-barrel protein [Flavobacterium sp.]